MLGRSVNLGRKILLGNGIPQNQIIRMSHSPGGIPGEVLKS